MKLKKSKTNVISSPELMAFAKSLRALLLKHGLEKASDSRWLKANLSDLFPTMRKEINLICSCAQEGLSGRLTALENVPPNVVIAQCVSVLMANCGTSEGSAIWAAEVFGYALSGIEAFMGQKTVSKKRSLPENNTQYAAVVIEDNKKRKKPHGSILEKGKKENQSSSSLNQLLIEAIKLDRKAEVISLLEKGADPNGEVDYYSNMLGLALSLGWGVQERAKCNIADILLKFGGDVNKKCMGGQTPLYWAVEKDDITVVKFLLEHGADVNLSSSLKDKYPLNLAIGKCNRSLGNVNLEIVKLLLDKKADVNARDDWGSTPLCCAVTGNHFAAAKLLIENGADTNVRFNNGNNTPLSSAVMPLHNISMIKLLLDNGAIIEEFELNMVKNYGSPEEKRLFRVE